MHHMTEKNFKKQENIITGPTISTLIFQIELIICNSFWMTYDGDHFHH